MSRDGSGPRPSETGPRIGETVERFELEKAWLVDPVSGREGPGEIVVTDGVLESVVWLEGAEVPSEQDLRIQLRAARQGSAAPNKMLVLGSAEAKHGTVVMVLDAGNDVGMDEVQLAVDEEY